jgi:hypothetical protein
MQLSVRRISILLTMCLLAIAGGEKLVAQTIRVQASVNSSTVGTEEAVSYTLLVQGSDGSNIMVPAAPTADGMTLLQSVPGTQRSVSITNGQMSQSFSFTWTFRPTREGATRIEAATVNVGGTDYRSQPIDLRVVPQSQIPARRPNSNPFNRLFGSPANTPQPQPTELNENDIFIRAFPSSRTAFQNEQIVVEYRLYFKEGIQLRQSRLTDSWDAEGFWREELDVETRPIPRIAIENGMRYNMIVLKRAAVFPTRAGPMSIDPLKIESEALLPFGSRDPFQSLFSLRTRFTPVQLASSTVNVEARPLPAGAPAGFNGAVGSYAMTVVPDRTQLEVGESIQLTVTISGRGNLATLDAPELDIPAAFELYDPQVTTTLDRSGSQLSGRKTFRYVLIARSNGTFEIPAVDFTFFDPSSTRFRTTSSSVVVVTVTGTASTPDVVVATTNGMPVNDFAPLFVSSSNWKRVETYSLHNRLWPYLLVFLPLLMLGSAVVYQRRRDRYDKDVTWARGRRAHPLSRKNLKRAMVLLKSGDTTGYFEELERAVLGFIGNRLNVAERGQTREQLGQVLLDAGVDQSLRTKLRVFLDTCDKGRFAPASISGENKEEAFDEASAIIPDIDEQVSG